MRGTINPTRMELTRLKKSLAVAERGHKLLKDKQDAMVQAFMGLIRRNEVLRRETEAELLNIFRQYRKAELKASPESLKEAVAVPATELAITAKTGNVLNVAVPKFKTAPASAPELTYGFGFTPANLDMAVLNLGRLVPRLAELAAVEKACDELAAEIERTRRRVNAIEYIMIPDMQAKIHYIVAKLDDNERSNITRLMKAKEMIIAKNS